MRCPVSDLVVIVPSRGRPEAAHELAETFAATCTADTELVFGVDSDDPRLAAYQAVEGARIAVAPAPSNMVMTLNYVCDYAWAADAVGDTTWGATLPTPFGVAFMGDDHRPRTCGWDQSYLEALHELGTGIVYGDDLLQGEKLPTQVAMTSDIVRALGYMAPPALTHMYVDNFWLDLGRRAGCLRHLPDVVVEHLHPVAGKADWDEGHIRVNAPQMYSADRTAYARYTVEQLQADVDAVKALR